MRNWTISLKLYEKFPRFNAIDGSTKTDGSKHMKKSPDMRCSIILVWFEFRFLGDCFSQIFLRQPTMVADIFTQHPGPVC